MITGAGEDARPECDIEIRKLDAAILSLGGRSPSVVMGTAAIVEEIAAILAESAGDLDEADRQLPFRVSDRGDTWRVRGSRNADRAIEGPGPFHLEMRKRDGAIVDMSFEAVLHMSPEVRNLLRGKI